MTQLDRRSFLKGGAAAAAGVALGGPFAGFAAQQALAAGTGKPNTRPLTPLPDMADGVTRLALPAGFAYRSFQPSSKAAPLILDDGSRLPGRHDGMAAFAGPGHNVLIRNHEENGSGPAFGAPGSPVYDSNAPGGTSTVRVTGDGQVIESYASLSGTQNNCSGGPMPWGAWVTCEETVNGPDVGNDFTGADNTLLTKPHGGIFEVPVTGDAAATPITAAGRFAHESVALDPADGALYLSEDNFAFPSGFYKYVPPAHPMQVGAIQDGGTLWMLKVVGVDRADLARSQPAGATYDIEWVPIATPWFDDGRPAVATRTNDEAINFVSSQGFAQGAAGFARLEGTIYDHNIVYFTATQGGGDPMTTPSDSVNGWGKGFGQIWAYHVRSQKLELVFESPNRDVLDFPDNVTTSRRGTLIVCEDHDQGNFLRGLTRGGQLFTIAQNVSSRPDDEFAGSTFSPNGDTLYVNVQTTLGRSFAIWGPWESIGV
jgi:secreted PhoX family phosphatase